MSTLKTNYKLSATDWAHIVTMFERGEKNIRELAEQFGVTKQAISKGLQTRGVKGGSRLAEVMNEVADSAREARDARVKQANNLVENYTKWLDVIAKLTMKKVIDGSQTQGGIALHNADILALKNATSIVEKCRQQNWEILDIKELLGENAELPDLNVGEYTPEELDRIRQANEDSYLEGLDDDDADYDFNVENDADEEAEDLEDG